MRFSFYSFFLQVLEVLIQSIWHNSGIYQQCMTLFAIITTVYIQYYIFYVFLNITMDSCKYNVIIVSP